MMKCEKKAGLKKNHGLSIISPWFEEEMEQERRAEYRAPSPFSTFFYEEMSEMMNRNVEQNIGLHPPSSITIFLITSFFQQRSTIRSMGDEFKLCRARLDLKA
jgi:hypothetical protein